MYDLFCIFTTGGLILWYKQMLPEFKFEIVNNLIKTILLDEKRTVDSYKQNDTILKWKILNDINIIFLVAYKEAYNLLYVDQLLDLASKDFSLKTFPNLKSIGEVYTDCPNYSENFVVLLKKWQQFCTEKRETPSKSSNFPKKKNETPHKNSVKEDEIHVLKTEERKNNQSEEHSKKALTEGNVINSNLPRNRMSQRSQLTKSLTTKKKSIPVSTKKEARKWDDIDTNITNHDIDKFDESKDKNLLDRNNTQNMIDESDEEGVNLNDQSLDSIDQEDKKNDNKKGFFSKFTSSLTGIFTGKELTEEDLEPVMKIFIDNLMEKNVAREIAENLCNSLKKNLLKTKTQSFTTIKYTVKEALKENIYKILTPKQEFDLLKFALANKNRVEPYKIVFIGVNGVGKSTNLAKVAYMLKTQGNLKVMLAACDNFRSGAVEQLKAHAKNLDVPVYDKGYKDDAAYIAREAIIEAKRNGFNCVLIDTAGRMQDNEPLMKSLAKLVEINTPDVILFVGEALVGNDGVDQLKKFNQALIGILFNNKDYSKAENPRTIDGVLLTKFDTVDDKVGAALTMVYTTGKPIVYVGTGQKYPNLKKLNVNNVLNALFN